jgi:tetratricopeptide (TPR) repeat protein
VLRVSAVLGKVFSFEELAAASQQNEDELLDALDEAVGAQLVSAGSDGSFSFTHDKIREVLYEELNPIRRRRLHRLAAEGLERNRENCYCAVEKLAHHYIQAGDYERGLEYAKQAAHEAERVFAFDEAVASYARARDCAEALGLVDEQLAQDEAIGKAYMLHGETILAGGHFERALRLATEPAVRARLQCEAAASLVATGNQRGVEYVKQALEVLDPEVNPLETANALSIEGRFHHLAGRHKKALELLLRAINLVEPAAASEMVSSFAAPMISQIYAFTAGAYQHFGLFADADRWAQRSLEFGIRHNILFAQAAGHEFSGEDAVHSGNFEFGLECAEKEFEIAARMESRERRAWTHYYAALCYLHLNRLAEAERQFVDGLALAEAIGEKRVMGFLKSSLAVLRARFGQFDEAMELAKENFAVTPSSLIYSRFEALRCLASVYYQRALSRPSGGEGRGDGGDDLDEAERLCSEAHDLVAPTESRVSQLWLGPLQIEVLFAQAKKAEERDDSIVATQKRNEARDLLQTYQELVAVCQSPRFAAEATRLEQLVLQR